MAVKKKLNFVSRKPGGRSDVGRFVPFRARGSVTVILTRKRSGKTTPGLNITLHLVLLLFT
jgi:hypothetical protein